MKNGLIAEILAPRLFNHLDRQMVERNPEDMIPRTNWDELPAADQRGFIDALESTLNEVPLHQVVQVRNGDSVVLLFQEPFEDGSEVIHIKELLDEAMPGVRFHLVAAGKTHIVIKRSENDTNEEQ